MPVPRSGLVALVLLGLLAGGCGAPRSPAATTDRGATASIPRTTRTATAPITAPATASSPRVRSTPLPPQRVDAGRVFALLDPGETTTSATHFAALSSVDGLVYRALWSRLETAPGMYDWSSLDNVADVARAARKPLTLHVAPDLPNWLPGLGAQTYTYTSPLGSGTAAVPWDATYLARHGAFVAALATHLRTRGDASLVAMVSVGAPVAEMSLVGCRNGVLGTGPAYDRAQYLDAWKTSFAAHRDAFADSAFASVNLAISAPVPEICLPDGDGAAFHAELMRHALSLTPRAVVFAADLNALGSSRLGQVDAATRRDTMLHFQTIWSYTDDPANRFKGPLRDAVCSSWRAGARYIEIYKADLLNTDPAVQAAIAAARDGAGC